MRITQSSLDLASSHAVSASLEGRRTVTAWDQTGKVELDQAVKISLSGAGAAQALAATARGMTGNGHGLGTPRGIGTGPSRASANGLAHAQAQAAAASAAAASAPADGAAADDYAVSPDELARSAWLLLLRLTGNEDAAAALATRLAEFAQQVEPKSEAAAALRQAAARYAAGTAGGSGVAQPPPAPEPQWGYREDVSVKVTEQEQTSFAAAGTVQTADGRTIDIAAAFQLVRQETISLSASLRLGAAARDPLTLSLAPAGVPTLGQGTQQVDINNDGTAETVAALASSTRYLVRDLNGNGTVDGGAEMFGPATDNGFAELAALDTDGNGWVDEGDAGFAQLSLWTGNEGDELVALKDAGVGALAAQSVATQYQYGAQTGTLAASSVFLYEDGRAGIAGELKLYA